MNDKKENFVIGGVTIEVCFINEHEDLGLIPSFKYFHTDENIITPDIRVRVGSYDHRVTSGKKKVLLTNNGSAIIQIVNRKYRFIIRNKHKKNICIMDCDLKFKNCCCEPLGNKENRSLGLRTAFLILYVGASPYFKRLLIHSSTIKKGGKAYCFLGNSGEGKSTQSVLWMKNIGGCSVLNDDMPILQIDGDAVKVWGSPWSGKTNYYINDSAELCAMVKMSHGNSNKIKRVLGVDSYKDLISSCSCFTESKSSCSSLISNVIKIISKYPVYEMSCLPEASAALLCYNTIKNDIQKRKSGITA